MAVFKLGFSTIKNDEVLIQQSTAIDANAASVTTALKINRNQGVGIYIKNETGTSATHVITIQASPDGTNWFDTTGTVTGDTGNAYTQVSAHFIRAKVTTVEGGVSTVAIFITVT